MPRKRSADARDRHGGVSALPKLSNWIKRTWQTRKEGKGREGAREIGRGWTEIRVRARMGRWSDDRRPSIAKSCVRCWPKLVTNHVSWITRAALILHNLLCALFVIPGDCSVVCVINPLLLSSIRIGLCCLKCSTCFHMDLHVLGL